MTPRELDGAAALVRETGGPELLERLIALDRLDTTAPARPDDEPPPAKPTPAERVDYDVALVGGGLSLLYAPLLAARGARVAVFERHRAGVAHREWNASAAELEALVTAGLVDRRELEALIVARYASGFCRFGSGPAYEVHEVLDCAVDAGALLRLARTKAEATGVHIYDGHELRALAAGPEAVRLRFAAGGGVGRDVTARLVMDGRGAQSSFATADLVCPTVGGVLRGIASGDGPEEVRKDRGEILVTTEGIDGGRQHLWEAFPGRDGEVAVYLFYYEARTARAPGALLALYARFFERLRDYKRGDPVLVRPTFGYIPGWSRLAPPPAPPSPRIVLVGDAAARHSPLTLCGFGATLRSLAPATTAVLAALDAGARGVAVDDRPLHRGTGALAWLLARPPRSGADPGALNALLDAAFGTVYEMGRAAYAALLRDEMEMRQFVEFLRRTAARRPQVYRDVLAGLGLYRTARWGLSLAGGLRHERLRRSSAAFDRGAAGRAPTTSTEADENPS